MKICKLVLLILLPLLFAYCSVAKTADNEVRHITGRLFMTGNEPFAKLALIVGENETYILEGKEELIKMLASHQGEYADVAYNKIKDDPGGKALEIIDAKLKTNDNKK